MQWASLEVGAILGYHGGHDLEFGGRHYRLRDGTSYRFNGAGFLEPKQER